MSVELVMISNHFIFCRPLALSSILPSNRVFSKESRLSSGGQNFGLSASTTVLSMNIQGWFPLGLTDLISLSPRTVKSLLQHHYSKASILWCSAFFMTQLSHPYMITGKAMALTTQTIVGKMMCLLFNMLSKFGIGFFPRRKHLLISPSAVTLKPKKIKSVIVSTFPPYICHEMMEPDAMIWDF